MNNLMPLLMYWDKHMNRCKDIMISSLTFQVMFLNT